MGPLLERDGELGALRDAIASAMSGGGVVVIVSGPAGIGKSSVLRAATQDVEASVLRAVAGPHETEIPFELVRSLLSRSVGALSLSERDMLLAGPARAAAPLLGFGEDGMASETAFALHGLLWLCNELAAAQPLVLVVDDAHWADEASLRFLAYLARRIDELPVALMLGVRSNAARETTAALLGDIAAAERTRPILLRPLSHAAAEQLAQGRESPYVVAAAGGNPFLLVSGLAGPEALVSAVERRLVEIGPAARAVGEAVALLDGVAEVTAVGEVTGLPVAEVVKVADRLSEAGLLAAGTPLRAAHPLFAEALLAGLGPTERAATHARAAASLARFGADPERVASHLLAAPPAGDPDAVQWLRRAAASASRAGAPEAATRFLERALREPPDGQQVADVEYELGTVATRIGRPAGVERLLSALDATSDPRRRFDIARQIGVMSTFIDDTRRDAVLERVSAELPAELEQQRWVLRAGRLFNDVMAGRAPVPERLAGLRANADAGSIPGRFIHSVLALHGAMFGTPADQVERDARTAIGTPESYTRAAEAGMPMYWAFAALDHLGLCDAATAGLLDRAKRSARERGTLLGLTAAHVTAAEIAAGQGTASEALAEAQMALELAGGHGLATVEARSRIAAAGAHLLRDEQEPAAQRLDELGSDVGWFNALYAQVTAADLLLAEGRTEAARDILQRVGEVAQTAAFSSANNLDWRSRLAGVLAALGETAEAFAVADAAVAEARRCGGPRPLARALRARALAGPADERAAPLGEAMTLLDDFELPLDRARVALELGAHLRRCGERRVARVHLGEALDLADRLGAVAVARRAREELLASGARPRRTRRWGLDALTPSELRVARLAAGGMSNREIAAELFVTPKTVEVHLGRCYRKLDIAGRAQLAAALDA